MPGVVGRFELLEEIAHGAWVLARLAFAFAGRLLAEPFLHNAEVRRAEFSRDGRRLLTASFGGSVKVWDLALLRPPLPAAEWLPFLAEALGGKSLGLKDSLLFRLSFRCI